mmetsp:Transcript_11276/g.23891  ORF Transcript_11276/g.23891 Transcript_11276/m.23891 type:complete len:365 (-) Transcript_11276:448-1542(-)
MSPTFRFGTGKTRQLSGLFQRSANPATSSKRAVSSSASASPGTGTVSMPTPQTLLTFNKSEMSIFPSVASCANRRSSHKGSIRPLYPVSLMPNSSPDEDSRVWIAVVIAAVAAIVPAPPKPFGTSFKTSTADATLPSSSSDGLKEASSPRYSSCGDEKPCSWFFPATTRSQIDWRGRTTSAIPAAKLLPPPLLSPSWFFGGNTLARVFPASLANRSFTSAPFSRPIANRMQKASSVLLAALAAGKKGTYGPRFATQNRKFASPPSSGFPSLELSRTVSADALARPASFAGSCTEHENRPDGSPTIFVQTLRVSGQLAGPSDTKTIPCSSKQSSKSFSRSSTTPPLSLLLPSRYSGKGLVAILTV